jgi:hypothetical protein
MDRPQQLTNFQIDLAGIFFALDASDGYLVAGGAALVASDLIVRPTEGLDLLAATPTTSVTQAKDASVQALQERDHDVLVVQSRVRKPNRYRASGYSDVKWEPRVSQRLRRAEPGVVIHRGDKTVGPARLVEVEDRCGGYAPGGFRRPGPLHRLA